MMPLRSIVAAQESRSPDVIDELIDGFEVFLIPLRHDEGLLDAVQVVLQQTQSWRVSHGLGKSLAVCAEGVPLSAQHTLDALGSCGLGNFDELGLLQCAR